MDKKIRPVISILNSLGIPTTGSCQGHIDHGAPAPWIKVTPTRARDFTPMLRKVKAHLRDFYENRTVPDDARIVTQKANSGFWVHNGGGSYDHWRAFVK